LPIGEKDMTEYYMLRLSLSPDTKDSVLKIIDSWEGRKSEEKLKEILGHDKAESLMKKITRTTTKNKAVLTPDLCKGYIQRISDL
jgi:hypothetical protein